MPPVVVSLVHSKKTFYPSGKREINTKYIVFNPILTTSGFIYIC
jgi:hypothetical protein